jgi:hypothetical protein
VAPPTQNPQPPQTNPEAAARPWQSYKGMIEAFGDLHGRLGSDYEHLYRETLQQYGVEHSNQFRNSDKAIACYRQLLAKVLEVEAAAREDKADGETPAETGEELAGANSRRRSELFAKMREELGDAGYFAILNAHGFQHAAEVTQLSTARAIYRELQNALDSQTVQEAV